MFVANITISADTANYVLNTAKVTGYKAGKTDMTLTINSGVIVSSSSTGSYAFTVDTSWAVGDTVTIVNNGTILGRGGNGGNGGTYLTSPRNQGFAGSSAGPALLVQRATTMNNLNRIAGGGGGGGGGGAAEGTCGKSGYEAGGGGGGGGIGVSTAGLGAGPISGYSAKGSNGTNGTLTAVGGGGAGGSISCQVGGAGGSGGSYGSSGSSGVGSTGGGGSGGGAGACIVGNSNITYVNTGTRNGSIS
jgi:hypothetical protein